MNENKEREGYSRHLLGLFDSWRLGVGIFALFVVGVLLWNFQVTIDSRELATQSRQLARQVKIEQQARIETERAAHRAEIQSCYQRNAQTPVLLALLAGLRGKFADDQNLAERFSTFIAAYRINTPTVSDCDALADRLDIPKKSQ